VRERAGSIEVKIVTSSNATAQRVSSELDTMRQNLDAAGLRLGQAEVSYQQGDSGHRDGQKQDFRPPQEASNKDGSIFTLSEVAE
jgi:flagellar hook-length control protein FliK